MADKVKLAERYGASEHGNYYVIDTIGVPHPYCIGPKHVAHAADRFHGLLGEDAIRSGEMAGIHCQQPKCRLSFDEHQKAALVACKVDASKDDEASKELHAYLLKCKDMVEADGIVGFAFMLVSK